MADSAIVSVRLSTEAKEPLAVLAGRTRRTSSFLAAEAITDYVALESAIVEAVDSGRAAARVGTVTPHAEVARQARAGIGADRSK